MCWNVATPMTGICFWDPTIPVKSSTENPGNTPLKRVKGTLILNSCFRTKQTKTRRSKFVFPPVLYLYPFIFDKTNTLALYLCERWKVDVTCFDWCLLGPEAWLDVSLQLASDWWQGKSDTNFGPNAHYWLKFGNPHALCSTLRE